MLRIRFSPRAILLAALAIGAPPAASAASFPAAVRAVLDSQSDGRLASMDSGQRGEMTNCVISTLAGLPGGKKKYIAEGASLDEQEHRFGEVVMEDRAKWKQKIASVCGKIAMSKTTGNK